MNPALQKTISVLVLIFLGFLLKYKIRGKEQIKGIKTLILSIALPATIFIALLKIEFEASLFYLPIFALFVNGLLFFLAKYSLPWFKIDPKGKRGRTITLLFPSLAPGLSCFPFIMEYGSEDALAMAALADVGNKVFVLVILYLVAMHWYFKLNTTTEEENKSSSRLKQLLLSLVKEPVNLAIILALVLLYGGWSLESLPVFLQEPVSRMSLLMTPMVLLFIGMAVKIDLRQFRTIGVLLLYRSALAFLISGLFLLFVPMELSLAMTLVLVAFPQSAVSFWPFAHMSVISEGEKGGEKTFDIDLALNFLALSLPFSTILILSISVFPSVFMSGGNLVLIAAGLFMVLIVPRLISLLNKKFRSKQELRPGRASRAVEAGAST
ncbi:MAG TPA: AEC family transporter [Saprospiraceae bacterium]|nr:AEC family transporter [Saprospiraceae bacterium]